MSDLDVGVRGITGATPKPRVYYIRACRGCTREFTDTLGSDSDGYCPLCDEEPPTGYVPAHDHSDGYFQNSGATSRRDTGRNAPASVAGALLAVIRKYPGEWTPCRIEEFYRGRPLDVPGVLWGVSLRSAAHAAFEALADSGHLARRERGGRTFYTVAT